MLKDTDLKTIFKFNIFSKNNLLIDSTNYESFFSEEFFVISANNSFIKDIWLLLKIFNKYSKGAKLCLCLKSNNYPNIKNFLDCLELEHIYFFNIPQDILEFTYKNNQLHKINKFFDEYLTNLHCRESFKNIFTNLINKSSFLLPNLMNHKYFHKKKYLKNNKFGVIVHARMSSSRLPGKAMLDIDGEPVILKILKRMSGYFGNEKTILSTSCNKRDDYMASFIEKKGFQVYRGEEENLASRFVNVASDQGFTHIVRVTGDDLFRDLNSITMMLKKILESDIDYIFSDDLILGCNSEIMTFDSLLFTEEFSSNKNETHALSWYLDRSDIFKTSEFFHNVQQRHSISLMLDELRDYESISKFWKSNKNLFSANWDYYDLINLIDTNLDLFNYHPSDIGLLSRDKKKYSFKFDKF